MRHSHRSKSTIPFTLCLLTISAKRHIRIAEAYRSGRAEHESYHVYSTLCLLQFALWDRFKELENTSTLQATNLMKFIAHLIASGSLSLALLKVCTASHLFYNTTLFNISQVVSFAELAPKALFAYQLLLTFVLTNYSEGLSS